MSAAFTSPRFDLPVDVEGHLARLPLDATCKGMFFRDLFALAASRASASELARRAGIVERRYVPFLDYPMHDNIKLTVAVAKTVHPDVSLGEGLRRLGHEGFRTFLSSHVGKVLVLAAGQDVGEVLMLAQRAYPLVMSFGSVTAERVDARTVVARCRDFPAFVETYQVGTLEAIFARFGVAGSIRTHADDIANVAVEATW